ncbi:MAG: ATP-binding cassette domain-containing protein, partial [Candidatus Heimdallarchaeota archaeon]|nr:ATP-binding cassette domain-containing protein [Candidatus Heimdallarchaeota archaeon]MCK4877399.1 ATP-binding cassette domain-containing protein [Candidatus Heimdallarchaeota archaeon]
MNNPVISFEDFSFRFHLRENWALKNINLQISKGDFVVITGSSGSGKSTLCYSILGLAPNFYAGELKGRITIDNQNTNSQSIFSVSELIGYIPQRVESSLITPYVLTELAFPLEYHDYEESIMHERIKKVSKQLKLESLLPRNPQKISEGEKQKIAIGCALIRNPNIILADEPLANLDRKNRTAIKSIFQKLKEEGKTIIIASHEYEQYFPLASKIVSLEQGAIVEEITSTNKDHLDMSKLRKIGIDKRDSFKRKSSAKPSKTLLNLKKILFSPSDSFKLSNISLTARSGEIVGIIGDNGSGKTTLLNIIGGIWKLKQGTLEINNKDSKDLSWQERSKNFGIVFQNPELQFFEETVKDEIALTRRNVGDDIVYSDITNLLKEGGLEKHEENNPHSLSHGEKRRLAFLASTFHNPEIIMLDEITNGLDNSNKSWIKDKLLDLKQRGKAILVISHDW